MTDVGLATEGDITIKNAKIYWRAGGYLPKSKVAIEMEKARANPKTHVPSTGDAFLYFVMKINIPEDDRMEVRHEFIELCG
jgi:hypothetical protein